METNERKRIDWIDVAKGLAILLVIIGHCSIPGVIRGAIFSFHMPLFFILSCMTYKLSTNGNEYIEKIEKSFCHLILTAVGIYFLRTVINTIKDYSYISSLSLKELKEYLANIINVFVVGSGVKTTIGNAEIKALGIPWFLLVLFWGRSLFDYLHMKLRKKWFYISLAICSIVGIGFGKIQWLPFSFDLALAIQPFFLFGYILKNIDIEHKTLKTMGISFVLWALLLSLTYFIKKDYMELTYRNYPLFPICYICAIAGTIFVSSFSQFILRLKKLCIPIKYLGKNSLIMLWVHCIDRYFSFAYKLTSHSSINAIIRIIVDLIVFYIIMFIIEKIKKCKVEHIKK